VPSGSLAVICILVDGEMLCCSYHWQKRFKYLTLVVLREVGWKRGHPSFKEKRRSLLKVYCCNVLADPALPAVNSHSLSINTPPQLKIIPES